jgi:hypothetical protein
LKLGLNPSPILTGELFDKFNQLTYNSAGQGAFYDVATNTNLSATASVIPADEFTATNYVHDPATGILTFDFTLKIQEYRTTNSTWHELLISGRFNSGEKVYRNTVSRLKR